jgi:hypothetical protein
MKKKYRIIREYEYRIDVFITSFCIVNRWTEREFHQVLCVCVWYRQEWYKSEYGKKKIKLAKRVANNTSGLKNIS